MPDRARLTSWSFSIALHAAAVLGSAFIVWTVLPAEPEPEAPVRVSFENPAPAPSSAPTSATSAASASAPAESAPSRDAPELPDVPEPPPVAAPSAPPPADRAERPTAAPPEPARYETTFVTAGASGAREIVYVVDASGSAITAFPDIVRQLERSLRALHPSQRFQVVLLREAGAEPFLFFREPPAASDPVLVDALPSAIDRAIAWVRGVVPGGPGDLGPALAAAVRARPDAVFVLARLSVADRAVDADSLLDELDRLNPPHPRTGARRTTIKAMQMIDPEPSALLRTIAETHGGPDAYTTVSLEDLRRTDR